MPIYVVLDVALRRLNDAKNTQLVLVGRYLYSAEQRLSHCRALPPFTVFTHYIIHCGATVFPPGRSPVLRAVASK